MSKYTAWVRRPRPGDKDPDDWINLRIIPDDQTGLKKSFYLGYNVKECRWSGGSEFWAAEKYHPDVIAFAWQQIQEILIR